MIPWQEHARARAPGGGELSLHQRGQEFVIQIDGEELMSSRRHVSEERLAAIGCSELAHTEDAQVLIGGLGMGYTLRAALDHLPAGASVVMAEISDAVVAWNHDHLGHLTGEPLTDPRVDLQVTDVARIIRESRTRFDAILLDVDNGPSGLTRPDNDDLYGTRGLAHITRALRPGGCLALWSAASDQVFEQRLHHAGLDVSSHTSRAGGKRTRGTHIIYVARVPTARVLSVRRRKRRR